MNKKEKKLLLENLKKGDRETAHEKLKEAHAVDIKEYGSDNSMRLTGLHETQHIDTFTYAVSDRGASIRIPIATVDNNWKGYLEDRRPSSNADPYRIVKALLNTLG